MGTFEKEPQDYFVEIDDDVMGITIRDLIHLENMYNYVSEGQFGQYIVEGYSQGFATVILKNGFENREVYDTHHLKTSKITTLAANIYRAKEELDEIMFRE